MCNNLIKFSAAVIVLLVILVACKKVAGPVFVSKKIVYQVKGTNFKINYIDSNSVFVRERVCKDEFKYEFTKGAGALIGISISKLTPVDTVFGWIITMDGNSTANAFSEGGAYMNIPYY
jgi:hypothetical protein